MSSPALDFQPDTQEFDFQPEAAPAAPSEQPDYGGIKPAEIGNIKFYGRQHVPMPGPPGQYGTVYSASREENGLEVLYPRIYDGSAHSDDEAWQHYRDTGQHMGKFRNVSDADRFAQKYHEDAAAGKYDASPIDQAVRSVPLSRPDYMQTEQTLTAPIAQRPTPVSPEAQQYEADLARANQVKPTLSGVAGTAAEVLTAPTGGAVATEPGEGTNVAQGVQELQTPGTRARGAGRLALSTLNAATPLVGPAVLDANTLPKALGQAFGFGEGYVGGKAAKKITKVAGGGEEAQNIAEGIGQLSPVVAHAVLRPEIGVRTSPDATAVAGSVRGAGAGIAVTPEAVTVRGKVGPLEASKTFTRGAKPAEKPALTPQTIEGELAKNPATRDEIANAQAATNYAGPEQAKAAVVAQRQAAAAAVEGAATEKPPAVAAPPEAKPAPKPEPKAEPQTSAPAVIGEPTAKPRTNGQPLEHGFDFRPAEDVGQQARDAVQKEQGALPRGERRKVERTPEEQQTQTLFGQARKELGEDATSDQVMARVEELKKAPVDFKPDQFKHRSTQVNIPEDSEAHQALETTRARISDSDLAGKGKDVGGNHVTVRWGLQAADDDKLEKIKQYLSSVPPFEAKLGKTEKFEPSESSEGAAVIQSPVEAPELKQIHDELAKHGDFTEPTFKDYKPHATVAYVKAEKADRYVGMSPTAGKPFPVNSIAVTNRQGKQEEVKLGGETKTSVPETKPTKAEAVAPKKETASGFQLKPPPEDIGVSQRIEQAGKDLRYAKDHGYRVDEAEQELADAKAAKTGTGATSLADAVYQKLKAGESLGNVTAFNKLAEEHFGSSRVSGQWTPKDAFDAMEAGVNKHLLDRGKDLMEMPAEKGLKELRELMPRITSQGTRTDEQIKNQQFSTPPTESYIAAKVAGLKPSDVVLEPSAGNGGIAVWPKAMGAKTHVNEISDRRREMLKHVGFENPTAHDGELLNALLDPKVKPTVVLMNPPFSASTQKSYEAKNRNQYGFNHVDHALQRLEPGGRLVAILGGGQANEPDGGASLSGGSSGTWFKKVASQYHIRANVRINGKEYQKYGTSFATRIIVIDKDGPTTPERWLDVVKKNVDTLEEAYTALSKVEASRPQLGGEHDAARNDREVPAAGQRSPERARQDQAPTRSGTNPSAGEPGDGVRRAGVAVDRGRNEPADRLHRPDRSAGTVRPGEAGERVPLHQSEDQPAGSAETTAARSVRGSGENLDRERPLQLPEVEGLTLGKEKASAAEQEDSSAYVTYKPTLKGPQHPGNIVESKTMATVPLPDISYKPSLPDSVIKEGKLSAVQLEAISIAGQQNDLTLPSGHRASALIGDGTGVGKGRIGAGVLWDNFRKGRKRLVWVSEKWDLMEDAKRDFNGIGAIEMSKNIKAFQKYNVTDPIDHQGVLFTTYALIRSGDKKGNTRVAQLEKWLKGNDEADGAYILFDESHNLKNAVTGAGNQPPSEIGKAVKSLLERTPKLRTASLSATAATDVMNLGYLDRLGLWGPGTSFPNGFPEFAAQISGGGISAMEMVARELKAQGKYLSRTLSFKGVTYHETEHKLTADQKALYRTAVKAWQSVVERAEDTIKNTTGGGNRQVSRFLSLFYGAQLRFFNVLLTTLKIPTAVERANQALAEGKSVVITLVNTNEAAQNREKNKERPAAGDDEEPPDYDFGPAEMLTDLVREHYPTQQYKDDVDSEGRIMKVPVTDADGNPVQNPQAIQQRDEMIQQVQRDLKLPANPLDILINSFGGPAKAAELTGRKERYDESIGKFVKRGDASVKRDQVNLSEMRAFQSGKKRVAILSNAAGTGISLHADNNAGNQQKRHHITLQMGWSADKAMQMLGRTHRANQVHPPEYDTIVTDLGGEKRFSATIAKRLGSLGALSKGQKSAIGGNDAMDKVNFESDQGKKATKTFYEQLLRNVAIPGTEGKSGKPLTGMTILKDLRVLKYDAKAGVTTVPDADRTNVTRLLNRLLALDPAVQNAVYDYYYDIFQATVQQAVEDGSLDTGVKELPGDKFDIKGQQSISKEPKTGAETFYYPVDAKVKTNRMPPEKIETALKTGREQHARLLRGAKGKLMFAKDAREIVHANGHADAASYVVTPSNGTLRKTENWRLHDYEEVKPDEHDAALAKWKEQYDAAPDHETEEHHLIGGAVLRWWNQIRDAANEHLHIYTAVDSKTGKRVVGVEVPAGAIQRLLTRITGNASTVSSGQLATDVLKNNLTFTLEQNLQVKRGFVGGKRVIQIMPPSEAIATNLKRLGIIYERGVTPVYYVPMVEIGSRAMPNESVVERLLEQYPVQQDEQTPTEKPTGLHALLADESGSFTPSALAPARVKKVYSDFIDRVIDQKLDLGDKYRRVAEHDPVIAKMLHEKDNAPRYFRDKAQSNVDQVTQGLSEPQIRLAAMLSDSDAREYLEENHPDQFEEAQNDRAVMAAVQKFKQYQEQLSALRINLGWHVRRDLSMVETEDGEWEVIDRDGNAVETFEKPHDAQDYIEQEGKVLDHLKRTYPEHLREPLMGATGSGPNVQGGSYGGIRPPKPDKKQRLASGQYFYEHGAKDFSGYLQSYTQASHATLNKRIYDELTDTATPWKEGTAQPTEITYDGKTYYRPDVALSMRSGVGTNRVKNPLEYRAYDPAKDDKLLIKSFEDGWGTLTTGKPGIGIHDRWLAPKEVVDALDNYDKTRGYQETDSIRRFFQEQIVGLFGPTVHMLNIMRRLAHVVGTGAWDPRVWPYYQKLFFSQELRDRMAEGLADDAIDALSKHGTYTSARDIGSLHAYFLGNLNPANWVRQTVGKFSKGLLFDPKFMGGFGGMDQKARVLAFDYLREESGMGEEEASKNVDDGFGNYNRASWTERMKRWAKVLLFPGWDFSSLKWFLRHPFKTAIAPAVVTLGANLALNLAGKNKDQDKYDYGYLHYGDRKVRSSLFTESMAMHIAQPVLEAGKAFLEGGDARDVAGAAGEGVIRGAGGMAGSLRPDIQLATSLLTNRQYPGGQKEIYKPEDAHLPGSVLPNRKLEKLAVFALVKTFPAVNRFLDSSYDNVDLATGAGSVLGVTNYRSGAEERLKANVAKSMGYSENLSALAERDPEAAEKFASDPAKAAYLIFHNDLSQLGKDLSTLDKQKGEIALAPGLSAEDRKNALGSIAAARKQLLTSADALNDALNTTRMQMKKASTVTASSLQ
jgi:2'-5' RNA ligase